MYGIDNWGAKLPSINYTNYILAWMHLKVLNYQFVLAVKPLELKSNIFVVFHIYIKLTCNI